MGEARNAHKIFFGNLSQLTVSWKNKEMGEENLVGFYAVRMEVDGTWLRVVHCPVAGFGIRSVEPSGTVN
jgi:hypothetical protein